MTSLLESEGLSPLISVVDNGGGQDLERMLPPGTRVIRQDRNRGFSGGANSGILDWRERYPSSAYILIGSHDCHVRPDTLNLLLNAAAAHPEYGILAPSLVGREHRLPATRDIRDGVGPVPWVSGTCMLFRRECLDTVRGFDETYGSYCEDADICLRAADAGWLTGVVVRSHGFGLGQAHSEIGDVLGGANKVLLARRRGGMPQFVIAFFGLLEETARSALGVAWPFRPADARARSRLMLVRRSRALARVVKTYRRVRKPRLPGACPDGRCSGSRR